MVYATLVIIVLEALGPLNLILLTLCKLLLEASVQWDHIALKDQLHLSHVHLVHTTVFQE